MKSWPPGLNGNSMKTELKHTTTIKEAKFISMGDTTKALDSNLLNGVLDA